MSVKWQLGYFLITSESATVKRKWERLSRAAFIFALRVTIFSPTSSVGMCESLKKLTFDC